MTLDTSVILTGKNLEEKLPSGITNKYKKGWVTKLMAEDSLKHQLLLC